MSCVTCDTWHVTNGGEWTYLLKCQLSRLRCVRPPQSQSWPNNFLKTSVCADVSQHLHETNMINKCQLITGRLQTPLNTLKLVFGQMFYYYFFLNKVRYNILKVLSRKVILYSKAFKYLDENPKTRFSEKTFKKPHKNNNFLQNKFLTDLVLKKYWSLFIFDDAVIHQRTMMF